MSYDIAYAIIFFFYISSSAIYPEFGLQPFAENTPLGENKYLFLNVPKMIGHFSVREWVALCYSIAGKQIHFVNVYDDIEERNYFSFYNYEYYLDVSKQYGLMYDVKSLSEGLKESFVWYSNNADEVNRKPFMEYIDRNFC